MSEQFQWEEEIADGTCTDKEKEDTCCPQTDSDAGGGGLEEGRPPGRRVHAGQGATIHIPATCWEVPVIPYPGDTREAIRIHVGRFPRFLTLAYTVPGNFEGSTLQLLRGPGIVDVQKRSRAAPLGRTSPSDLLAKNIGVACLPPSALKRLVVAQFAIPPSVASCAIAGSFHCWAKSR